jgi:hypothetical protein
MATGWMVFGFRQSGRPYCFLPSPRKTRKKSIARTIKSAYITMTARLRFLDVLDNRCLGATPPETGAAKISQ